MGRASAELRVLHRHRIGRQRAFIRVSELVYRGEDPLAVLSWLHQSGTRIPGVCIALDPTQLHCGPSRKVFLYDGVTSDPRFEALVPSVLSTAR